MFEERTYHTATGVVDQDINPTKQRLRERHHVAHRLLVAQVTDKGGGIARQLHGRLFSLGGDIRYAQPRTFGGESCGDRIADAAGGAGDNCGLALQVLHV